MNVRIEASIDDKALHHHHTSCAIVIQLHVMLERQALVLQLGWDRMTICSQGNKATVRASSDRHRTFYNQQ